MEFDPVRMDIKTIDLQHNAGIEHVSMDIKGDKVFGALFRPPGEGPHPVSIILHGFPGHDWNLDIAHSLRRAGVTTFVFHYRGSWGSKGKFTFSNMIEDVKASVDHLEQRSNEFSIDPDRFTLIGHSMGGWAAMMSSIDNERIKNVIQFAGFNLGFIGTFISEDPKNRIVVRDRFQDLSSPLNIISVDALIEEVIVNSNDWDIILRSGEFSDKRVLMIGAKKDDLSLPMIHFEPVIGSLKTNGCRDISHHIIDSDHSFSDGRIELQDKIWEWLKNRA